MTGTGGGFVPDVSRVERGEATVTVFVIVVLVGFNRLAAKRGST
jgi:hypothetical protein